MKATIVTTTVNIPSFLGGYQKNANQFGQDVNFIVVGDYKSAARTAEYCATIPNCLYLDLPSQRDYLTRFPTLREHLPINSVERRNVGMMLAYTTGADVIITLDDDNLATDQDAIGHHRIVGTTVTLPTYGSSSGWFNVCSFLKEESDVEFYHRGYSPKNRWADSFVTMQPERRKVVVNAGFWLDDPDVDATTRLERKVRVTGYKSGWPGTIALARGTWTPFDCQNTALTREIIPAYFLSPYIGRHSDIFASYVINRLAEHFNHAIAFGDPWVLHDRHSHNLWKDLDVEREGMQLTDGFCDALRKIDIAADGYHQGFGEIISGLNAWARSETQQRIVEGMRLWHGAFEVLEGTMKEAPITDIISGETKE
jgi:hypothetical protein